MSLDERILTRLQEGLALRSFDRGKPLRPLPPRDPWPALARVWRGPEGPFIETVYTEILGRDADESGKQGFLPALNVGMPRAEVVRALLGSPEARSYRVTRDWLPAMARLDASLPLTRTEWLLSLSDSRIFVVQCYRRLLAREPGGAEADRWVRRLRLPIIGKRTSLIRALEKSKERAVLLAEMEQERLDGRFDELRQAIRDSHERLTNRLERDQESRIEVVRLAERMEQALARDATLQQQIEVVQRSVQSLEMLTQRVCSDRAETQARVVWLTRPAVAGAEESGAARMVPASVGCRLCGGFLVKRFQRRVLGDRYEAEYFQCRDCEMVQVRDPHWLDEANAEADATREWDPRESPFARDLAAFGCLLALREAGTWPRDARYLDVGGFGLLTRMLRDHGLDGWAYDPDEPGTAYARKYGYSRIDQIRPTCMDVVTSFNAMERLTDPWAFGREVRQVLTPTGCAVFSAGVVFPDTDLETWTNLECESGRRVTFWSRQALSHFAERLGFVSVGYFPTREGFAVVFSPMSCGELDARLEKAQAVLNRPGFLAESIASWDLPRGQRRNQGAEAARAIPGPGGMRCAS